MAGALRWIESALRSRASLRRSAPPLQVTELRSYVEYLGHAEATRQLALERRSCEARRIPRRGGRFTLAGLCWACAKHVAFRADATHAPVVDGVPTPNLREQLTCPRCRLSNRLRAAVELFHVFGRPEPSSRIYVTEQMTALHRWLAREFPHVTGSEFLGEAVPSGAVNGAGIRHEDLTRLSFGDASLDFILSFEVLEHIPRYEAALAECHRCLKGGGKLLLGVPFVPSSERTIVRARVSDSGEVVHLLPPDVHGDPVRAGGILCFYHFGWELLGKLREAGFGDASALLYWSEERGYLGGEQLLIVATR